MEAAVGTLTQPSPTGRGEIGSYPAASWWSVEERGGMFLIIEPSGDVFGTARDWRRAYLVVTLLQGLDAYAQMMVLDERKAREQLTMLDREQVGRLGMLNGLTRREREVVEWIGKGKTNEEIAQGLIISANTVKAHVQNSLRKLGLRSKAELRVYLAGRRSQDAGGRSQAAGCKAQDTGQRTLDTGHRAYGRATALSVE